ncbi:MAG: FAD-dependent oxidoreductase [Myxococcota bacterium]|nr:FAD-dependent oxidoreductase [Myxococcota bacterium]
MASLERIVVVGGSLAGLRAAEALRQKGFEGTLSLVGAENREPYDRPPLSKDVLAGRWEPEQTALARDGLAPLELDLHLGCRATGLDPAAREVELEDGRRLGFDGLVIATGATPRTLPFEGPRAGIHTLRTLDDCLAIRDELERSPRVAVVGAGFIGAEVAATCRARGLDVSLVEPMPIPFGPSLGDDVGTALCDEHRDRGVDLRLGVGVTGFGGSGRVESVQLEDGSEIAADVVVVGVGVFPETRWLESSGIELDNGVVCDATCATGIAGVVAAGDVARWPNPLFDDRPMRIEHWSNATEQARHAVETLLAGETGGEPFGPVPFVWSDQYDLKIQSAGYLPGFDDSRVVHGSLAERKFVKLYARKGRLVGAVAFGEPRQLIGYRRALRNAPTWDEALAQAAQ